MTQWISIRGWSRFQHYGKRNAPWIKVYTDLLANDDYLGLSGHRRAILCGLWLAYCSSHARLRLDTRSLSRRLALRVTTDDLEALSYAGFIEFVDSGSLAENVTVDSPRAHATETETETETEKLQVNKPSAVNVGPTKDAEDEPEWGTVDEEQQEDFKIPGNLLKEMSA